MNTATWPSLRVLKTSAIWKKLDISTRLDFLPITEQERKAIDARRYAQHLAAQKAEIENRIKNPSLKAIGQKLARAAEVVQAITA